MAELSRLSSAWALLRGILQKFKYWLPFLLLDSTDYWERYIRPAIRSLTGADLVMPDDALFVGFLLALAWCAFLTYHDIRRDKLKLESELEQTVFIDPHPILQEYPGTARSFYFAVRNPSARAIANVGIYLTNIEPMVEDLNWLPAPLHLKHDNLTPHRESFNLNPRGMRHVDLVTQLSSDKLSIEHIIPGVNRAVPAATYVLTIRVEGETVALPQEAKFLVTVDHKGLLRCLQGSFVDLAKGLWEFRRDSEQAIPLLSQSITDMTENVNRVSGALGVVTKSVNRGATKPISRIERMIGIKTILDRLLAWSPRLARHLNRATEKLEHSIDTYRIRANDTIRNLTGYIEVTVKLPQRQIDDIADLRHRTATALQSTKSFRATVADIELARQSTSHFTYALRRLKVALDNNIEMTENILEAFDGMISLAQEKVGDTE